MIVKLINILIIFIVLFYVCEANLSTAFNIYNNSCVCNKRFANNCAHFISNSLIRAGYSELQWDSSLYKCTSRRPIRARELRMWANGTFRKYTMAQVRQRRGIQYYFVYQGGGGYWGGHVLLKLFQNGVEYSYRGTGNYNSWPTQELYQ